MSDHGLEDDLFGGSDNEAPPQPPSPIASSSRGSPKPSGTATPAKQEDEGVADLFGEDEDGDAPPSPARARAATTPDTPISHSSRSRTQTPNPLEYPEEDVQDPGQQEATWATVAFPKWEGLKPTDGKIWQMRLPAYVNFESTPYDPTLYRAGLDTPPEDEDVNLKRSRMIQVRNTIRWKWSTGDDGKPKRQSNARLLRWSDGTVSMQLGSDLYDLAPSYGTTLSRKDDPPPKNPLPTDAPGADTTFLAAANDESGIMMTENTIAGHLSLVPASSSSKTHIELVKHVGQQHVKHSRMKVLDDIVDPEKAFTVQLNKKKATNKRQGGGGGRGGGPRKKRGSSDEEEDDPRYTFDTDLPGGGRGVRGGPKDYEAEYDEEDGFVVADSDDEDAIEDDQDEEGDDAAYGSLKKSKKSKGKKRKGEEEEMDEMEEADRKIEAIEREKKRAKREKRKSRPRYDTDEDDEPAAVAGGADGDGEEDMEMDVESD